MRPRFVRLGCAAALTAGLTAGCHSSSGTGKSPYPKDPLLLSKKPIEGGIPLAADASLPPLASAEPARPPVPATALVSATHGVRPLDGFAANRTGVAAQPMATIKAPIIAVPAVRSRSAEAADGIYGHSPDHRWLQGVLDKHYQGHFDLRYCDAAVEDRWGGKVRLEDDQRLAEFQDGDVIHVEGEIVPVDRQAHLATWERYPRYRIRELQLIRRKN